jgi:small subunit ribosomal protein S20
MPYHRQYDKSIRQDAKRNLRNQDAKSKMRTSVKKVRSAQSKEEAQEALKKAASIIDTIARKGIIKKKTAARKKSRLSKAIAKMS